MEYYMTADNSQDAQLPDDWAERMAHLGDDESDSQAEARFAAMEAMSESEDNTADEKHCVGTLTSPSSMENYSAEGSVFYGDGQQQKAQEWTEPDDLSQGEKSVSLLIGLPPSRTSIIGSEPLPIGNGNKASEVTETTKVNQRANMALSEANSQTLIGEQPNATQSYEQDKVKKMDDNSHHKTSSSKENTTWEKGNPRQPSRRGLTYAQTLKIGTENAVSNEAALLTQDLPIIPEQERTRSSRLKKEAAILERAEASTVWLRRSFNTPNDHYLEAVGRAVGDAKIIAINTDDKNRVEVMLSDPESTDQLVTEGIVIDGEWFKVYRVAERPLKVSLTKVPPYIPHSSITEALLPFGTCTPADCEPVHAFTKKNSQRHIVTYRRSVWLRVEKNTSPLPESIIIYFAGRPHTLPLSDGVAKCFACGKSGHIRARCPANSPNYEPVRRPTATQDGKPTNKNNQKMPDIDTWRASTQQAERQTEQQWVTIPVKSRREPNHDSPNSKHGQHYSKLETSTEQLGTKPRAERTRTPVSPPNEGIKVIEQMLTKNKISKKAEEKCQPKGSQLYGKGRRRSQSLPQAPKEDQPSTRARKLSLGMPGMVPQRLTYNGSTDITLNGSSRPNRGVQIIEVAAEKDDQTASTNSKFPKMEPPIQPQQKDSGHEAASKQGWSNELTGIGKAERRKLLKIGECFQDAIIFKREEGTLPSDPLKGMPIKIALEVYKRNLPFFHNQKMFQDIDIFLDEVAGRALMDSSDDPSRMPRKRAVPSNTSSGPEASSQYKSTSSKSSKRINSQRSPQKNGDPKTGAEQHQESGPPTGTPMTIKIINQCSDPLHNDSENDNDKAPSKQGSRKKKVVQEDSMENGPNVGQESQES